MKKVVASAGVFAVGLAGLRGQNVTGLTPREQSKWWVVSAGLRSFYDDNSLNQADADATGSFGLEFRPGVAINFPLPRTLLSASYDFTLNYYEARPSGQTDQDHIFDVELNHRFSERFDAVAKNTFSYTDVPGVGEELTPTFQRAEATSIRNRFSVALNSRLRPVFGLSTGYKNSYQDFLQSHRELRNGQASLSALLDIVEHQFNVDAQRYASPQTVLFAGYRVGFIDYTSTDFLAPPPPRDPFRLGQLPSVRNSRSHSFYVGVNREFTPRISLAGRAGAQLTDYYNQPNDSTSWSPYVEGTATYTYRPGSTARLGVNVVRIPVDISTPGSDGEVTRDGLATAVFGSLSHQFGARLSGSLGVNLQHVVYNGGQLDGESYDFLSVSSRLDYKLRENLFAELGYDWSGYDGTYKFTRNRVYLGIRATY